MCSIVLMPLPAHIPGSGRDKNSESNELSHKEVAGDQLHISPWCSRPALAMPKLLDREECRNNNECLLMIPSSRQYKREIEKGRLYWTLVVSYNNWNTVLNKIFDPFYYKNIYTVNNKVLKPAMIIKEALVLWLHRSVVTKTLTPSVYLLLYIFLGSHLPLLQELYCTYTQGL